MNVAGPASSTLLDLVIDRPAAGGSMLARHEGRIVLVSGAIPGERVLARVTRVGKGVVHAETAEVVTPSPDRRVASVDWRCGGHVLAHVAYARQLVLKGEIVADAFRRIGRMTSAAAPDVTGSPEHGYRMRARLHASRGRVGFYREGSHEICDAGATGQLLPATAAWLGEISRLVAADSALLGLELTENAAGDERACHLDLAATADVRRFARLVEAGPLVGLSAARADRAGVEVVHGTPIVTDVVPLTRGTSTGALRLRRSVRAFFQGNRFLLAPLVNHVVSLVPAGPVVDLYAGVGLFGLALASLGQRPVTLVEGDPVTGADLRHNAEAHAGVRVAVQGVERYLASTSTPGGATFLLDPPRTGLSTAALTSVVAKRPARVVYVSCDVATLARDARVLIDAGFAMTGVRAFDLFPNTAHIETVATFDAGSS